ncbi:exodeoxyribonuclease VII large subunit [Fluviispira multicolorata]|uniref:Exodeoxyribonuclease 7 large subunit n=1 Tax=Fluviispira multicolorata TaxID=2654512 RepID=A0A833N3N4_9BACT|nr:exodeoxyribonuclease VII large subunit [Fluviispira multicolorata]KAB8030014.1 exodeoxyribonuclease VII large subunit [Fluviispira multicolorata]
MKRSYQTLENKLILLGDTFSIKEEIKKSGGRWDASQKNWWLENSEKNLTFICSLGFQKQHINQTHFAQIVNTEILSVNEMSVSNFVYMIESVIKKNLSEKYSIFGEITSLKIANGHTFFDLADREESQINISSSLRATSISCILWAGKKKFLSEKISQIMLEDGTKIKILVSCDFRKEGARINAIIEDIDIQYTQGDLLLQRLAIVQDLKKRGLYDKNRELKIPKLPLNIALITAENSRACSDFMNELKLSKISFRITIYDCNMQGERTSENVCNAFLQIEKNKSTFDCIVISRGGGSKLDLRWFDDIEIAKKIAYSSLPVITAVGHFDDLSIADEVSCISEKTPTAAARFLSSTVLNTLNLFFTRMENLSGHLLRKFAREKEFLKSLENKLTHCARRTLQSEKKNLANLEHMLRIYKNSTQKALQRGFAIVYNDNEQIITPKELLSKNPPKKLKLEFASDCTNEHIFVDVTVKGISLQQDKI